MKHKNSSVGSIVDTGNICYLVWVKLMHFTTMKADLKKTLEKVENAVSGAYKKAGDAISGSAGKVGGAISKPAAKPKDKGKGGVR